METGNLGKISRSSPDAAGDADPRKDEIVRRGVTAAPGIVIGPAFVMDPETLSVPNSPIRSGNTDREVARFRKALEATKEELVQIKSDLAERMGDDHARIFDAHLLILDDIMVVEDTETLIRKDCRNAAWSFQQVIAKVATSFRDVEDEYLKDRFADILDVKKRVIRKLLGKENKKLNKPTKPSIVFAHDLSPSETAQLDTKVVLGYATDLGGRTSHTAILARSQGVAAVVGLDGLCSRVETGDKVILDGNLGTVVVNPLPDTLETYKTEIERYREIEEQLLTLTGYPAETLDNRKIDLVANIDLPGEVTSAVEYGAQGIGLFRTEYFFISQEQLPTEDEQYRVYRSVLQKMDGKPVTIRVLDIGGDKIAGYLHHSQELNPFMGWRGIRFLLTRKDIFKTQLRAIYRASRYGETRILIPLISQVDETIRAKEMCAEVRDELRASRFKIGDDIKIGIMIETPSAVALADALAKEVDFFSIGTNDLIQYTMAVDRGNSKISYLYHHLHPSLIRFLKMTVDAARKADVPVAVCGEMASDPLAVPVLIGLQVHEFSVSPSMMPEVKKIIRSVTYDECKMLVRKILKYTATEKIEERVRAMLKARCPDLAMFGKSEAE